MKNEMSNIWFLRFPGAARNAGPFRFYQPVTRRQFEQAMREHFGLEQLPAQTRCWTGTESDWQEAFTGKLDRGPDRNEQIRAAKEEGLTLRAIGARLGISHERVRQILEKGKDA
jgi:hypothetical protein